MTIRPSTPEIITVNSEALQTQIRDLLPSQNGFGSELQASNVITPIIDLTGAAEGSGLPLDLQTALAFGSQTAFSISNGTTVLANSPGFYRVVAASTLSGGANSFDMTDGSTTVSVYKHIAPDSGLNLDLVFWLKAGISLSATSSSTNTNFAGSIRQIADSEGKLINPSGYPL